jgi:hypothetical protein
MLNTINGFDLMLVIVIIGLVINVLKLNRECESYVVQIIEMSQDNYELTREVVRWEDFYTFPDLDHDLLDRPIEPPF